MGIKNNVLLAYRVGRLLTQTKESEYKGELGKLDGVKIVCKKDDKEVVLELPQEYLKKVLDAVDQDDSSLAAMIGNLFGDKD